MQELSLLQLANAEQVDFLPCYSANIALGLGAGMWKVEREPYQEFTEVKNAL